MTTPKPTATTKGAARRALILDQATDILARQGHAALTLRSVAAAAGISLGNLQYYFASHAQLIAALLDRLLRNSLDRARVHLAQSDTYAALDSVLAESCDRETAALFYELWAMAAHDQTVADAVRGFYDQYIDAVASVIAAVNPAVSEHDAYTHARVFVGLLEGASLLYSGIAAEPSDSTDALIRHVAYNILTGNANTATAPYGPPDNS